jgi:hypothetical protein
LQKAKQAFKKTRRQLAFCIAQKTANDPILGRVSESFDNSRGVAKSNAN